MRSFAEAYPGFVQQAAAQINFPEIQIDTIVQQLAAQLPWGHHQLILDKVKNSAERHFYIRKTVENGWSRNMLARQIETNFFERTGKAISNFPDTLPALQSDLVQQTIKNPYIFDFLNLSEQFQEKELEKALVEHLKQFMLELGKGFAYVGRQHNLIVNGDDFFLDLLFYNYNLKRFVIFELKIGDLKAEYAGKLNFYVNTVDEQVKAAGHQSTIGVLLCKTPNETVVKYALKGIDTPIGVSEYELAKALPKELKKEMPTIEELEKEIDESYEELKSPFQKKIEVLKEKLTELKGPEMNQVANKDLLFDIIDKSLLPLYRELLKRGEELKQLFHNTEYIWTSKDGFCNRIEEVQTAWKDQNLLKMNPELNFNYRFRGLLKAGTDAFDTSFQLIWRIDQYMWGFRLTNYNNQKVFFKKIIWRTINRGRNTFNRRYCTRSCH